jgi:hypothetical protein
MTTCKTVTRSGSTCSTWPTWQLVRPLLIQFGLSLYLAVAVVPAHAEAARAQALRSKFQALEQRLQNTPFNRPVVLDSRESSRRATGNIHAVVDHSFDAVRRALSNPEHWCDVVSLHANTKYCRVALAPGGTTLKLNIGKKTPQSLEEAPRVVFSYTTPANTPTFLAVELAAKTGPLGTSDYRIALEVIPGEGGQSLLHLTYSYSMNFAARMAMQAYLGTVSSSKVGFTVLPATGDGEARLVQGTRAMVERNTMRYYLAIDSFLAADSGPPAAQLEQRLQTWFTAVEQYPRQLHELERNEYLSMKRDEHLRQQTAD